MVEILEHHSQTLKGKTARRALSFISSIIKSYSPHKTVLTPSGATDSLSCRQPSVPASILFFIVWSFPWSSETSTMLRWGKFCLLETSEQTQQHLLHSPATEGAIAAWFCPVQHSLLSIELPKSPPCSSPNCADCSPGNPEDTNGDLEAAELMCTAKSSA